MRSVLAGLVLILAVATMARAEDSPAGMTGAEVGRLVRQALAAAGQRVTVADPLRPYPACAARPSVRAHRDSWAMAEISCPSPPWIRFLRTGLAPDPARDAGKAPKVPMVSAVVLKHSLAKGAQIGSDDLMLAPVPERGADQTFAAPGDVLGRRLAQNLGAGKPILARHLEPRWLVRPGTPLVLVAVAGNLTVSAPAEAVTAGAEGDVVEVRNLSTGQRVKGIVTGPHTVTAQTNMDQTDMARTNMAATNMD